METPEAITEEPIDRFEPLEIPLPQPVHGMKTVKGRLGTPEWWPTGARIAVVMVRDGAKIDPESDALQRLLTRRKYLTLNLPMPYMVARKSRPDEPALTAQIVRTAISLLGEDPMSAPAHVFAGGIDYGGVIAAHAGASRLRAEGMFFLSYPLHKQDDPGELRSEWLFRAVMPMLFIQSGERDRHCKLPILRSVLQRVGAPVKLHVVKKVSRQLKALSRSGRRNEEILHEVVMTLEDWMKQTLSKTR